VRRALQHASDRLMLSVGGRVAKTTFHPRVIAF
jgi:hypothetical protein